MNRKLSLLGWCVVSTNLTGLILLVIRVCRFYPCNHWAVDTRLAYAPAVAGLALAAAGLLRSRRIAGVWACGAVSLLLAVSVFLIDALNLLVDYHRWIERKMPVPWTWW